MTPKQVEYVAQAFYDAEHPEGWTDAPGDVQEQFKDLAHMAIAALEHYMEGCQAAEALKGHSRILESC